MYKKFLDGLFFGAGFAVAFIIIWALALWLLHPWHYMYRMHEYPGRAPQSAPAPLPGARSSHAPFKPESMSEVDRGISMIRHHSIASVRPGRMVQT